MTVFSPYHDISSKQRTAQHQFGSKEFTSQCIGRSDNPIFLITAFFTLYRIVSVFVKQIIRIKINLRFSRHPLIINIYRMRWIIICSGIDIIRQIVIMRAVGIYIRIKYSVIAGIRIGFQCIFYSD